MKEPLRRRQLLGDEDYPELGLGQETTRTTLSTPPPIQYVLLPRKHLDSQMEPASLIARSHRQTILEARKPVSTCANLMPRLELVRGEIELT